MFAKLNNLLIAQQQAHCVYLSSEKHQKSQKALWKEELHNLEEENAAMSLLVELRNLLPLNQLFLCAQQGLLERL